MSYSMKILSSVLTVTCRLPLEATKSGSTTTYTFGDKDWEITVSGPADFAFTGVYTEDEEYGLEPTGSEIVQDILAELETYTGTYDAADAAGHLALVQLYSHILGDIEAIEDSLEVLINYAHMDKKQYALALEAACDGSDGAFVYDGETPDAEFNSFSSTIAQSSVNMGTPVNYEVISVQITGEE